jgi:hypothetical protein
VLGTNSADLGLAGAYPIMQCSLVLLRRMSHLARRARARTAAPVCTENLNPDVMVVEAAEERI